MVGGGEKAGGKFLESNPHEKQGMSAVTNNSQNRGLCRLLKLLSSKVAVVLHATLRPVGRYLQIGQRNNLEE